MKDFIAFIPWIVFTVVVIIITTPYLIHAEKQKKLVDEQFRIIDSIKPIRYLLTPDDSLGLYYDSISRKAMDSTRTLLDAW